MPDEPLKDLEPPVAPVVNTTATINAGAGVALIFLSDTIHLVIGAILILLALYLFNYARKTSRAYKSSRRAYEALRAKIQELEAGGGGGGGGPRPEASPS